MITAEEAWAHVLEHARPAQPARRSIADAHHHILASPVYADRDIPACDRAAMDGFAVRAEDMTSVPATLKIVGEVPAGSPLQPVIKAGECVHIFTGANIPHDADTVVMVEDTEPYGDDAARFLKPVTRGQHIFRQGENEKAGASVIEVGTSLTAMHAAVCATVGCDQPEVYPRPKVGILTTGAELRDASAAVEVYEIRDSNGPMLEGVLIENHFPCAGRWSVHDDMDALQDALKKALDVSDVVLLTGGVSVGKYDLVPDAISSIGGEIVYHRVKIKPGKPQLFAVFPGGKLVFGLPGNPLSVMNGVQEFALPAMKRLAGTSKDECRTLLNVRTSEDVKATGKRRHYVLGKLVSTPDGLEVVPVSSVGSADMVAAARADGAIIVEAGLTLVPAGETVAFRPWRAVL